MKVIDRRWFLVLLIGPMLASAADARSKHIDLRNPKAGETINALAERSGYQLVFESSPRFSTKFVTGVVKKRTRRLVLKGPIFVAPVDQPDARPPRGWPCLTLTIRRNGKWQFPDQAVEDCKLQEHDRLRFTVTGYDPALAQ